MSEKEVEPADAMKLALQYLKLDAIFPKVVPYVGKTPYEMRLCVWNFWHKINKESTITARLARLRETERHGCQRDIEFKSPVTTIFK